MGTPALDIPSLVHKYVDLNVRASWFEKEVPRHEVWVDAFRMARTPVTVQQFNRFRSAIGEETDSHSNPDWPVSGVPHPAAVEYCVWMAKRLGLPIRLPTEVEWERAARGDDVRETPWNGPFTALCGNLAETGLGGPAPVGSFPLGASPFGVLDMVGNVDEWTSTVYAPYPGAPDSVPAEETWAIDPHVCRGGYWATGRDLARCSRRHAAYYESLAGKGIRVVYST